MSAPVCAVSPGEAHRHAVCGKLDLLRDIEIVHGLDEADAADLKQIVHVFAASGKALDHGQDEAEISGDELLPGGGVAGFRADQQGAGLVVFQHLEIRRVDAAYLHFALQFAVPLVGRPLSRTSRIERSTLAEIVLPIGEHLMHGTVLCCLPKGCQDYLFYFG